MLLSGDWLSRHSRVRERDWGLLLSAQVWSGCAKNDIDLAFTVCHTVCLIHVLEYSRLQVVHIRRQ